MSDGDEMKDSKPAKKYPLRRCRRGKHMWQPSSAKERACPDVNCKAKQQAKESRPTTARKVSSADASFALELLKVSGFRVQSVQTPAGLFVRVQD